ncbi:MAG: alpha/beta fold hydrolase [Parcubacteria group bacterium]
MKKWKKFEKDVFQTVKELNPTKGVYYNVRLVGKLSKSSRQIDVQMIEADNYDFMVFECKDKTRSVDTPVIEAFRTNLEDLGAKKGAIVSSSLYTEGAKNMAQAFDIDLLHFIDSENSKKGGRLIMSIVFSLVKLQNFACGFSGSSSSRVEFSSNPAKLQFLDSNNQQVSAFQVIANLWNETEYLIKKPGDYRYAIPDGRGIKLLSLNGESSIITNLHFDYRVVKKHFLGKVEIIEGKGLYNVKEKSFMTKEIITDKIYFDEVDKWEEISEDEMIKIKPTLRFEGIQPLPEFYFETKKDMIKNRKGQNISVAVDEVNNASGLAFVMHGLGGFKEQPHIQTMVNSFKEKGYAVVSFDTTNTFGESEGNYENATTTNYYEDLEDVISWAKTQSWYQEPFILAGHSLGGICSALYAQKYPERVRAVAPISTVVSGALTLDTGRDEIKEWQKTGWRISESKSKPGVIKKLPWSHMEDRLKFDLMPNVKKLEMPVLMIVGENDSTTPAKHQQILYDALPGKREIHVIKGAEHTFREKEHLYEINDIFLKWLDSLD